MSFFMDKLKRIFVVFICTNRLAIFIILIFHKSHFEIDFKSLYKKSSNEDEQNKEWEIEFEIQEGMVLFFEKASPVSDEGKQFELKCKCALKVQ